MYREAVFVLLSLCEMICVMFEKKEIVFPEIDLVCVTEWDSLSFRLNRS